MKNYIKSVITSIVIGAPFVFASYLLEPNYRKTSAVILFLALTVIPATVCFFQRRK